MSVTVHSGHGATHSLMLLSSSPSPSGTSLLQELVYLVSQGADPDEIGLMNIEEQLPVLEYPQPGLDIIQVLISPAKLAVEREW